MADKVDKPKKKAKSKKDEKGVLAALPSTRPERIGTRRAAASRPPGPKAAARPSATKTAAAKRPATAKPSSTAAPRKPVRAVPEERSDPRPRPVSEGAPGIGTAGARDQPPHEHARASGVELAATAAKAAGEVAQLGLTIGGHVLKRVVDRLPKP